MPSPSRSTSPTLSPSPQGSLGKTGNSEQSRSPEPARTSTAPSIKERVQAWPTSATGGKPMHEREAPPTLEELETMDKKRVWNESEGCITPAGSTLSATSKPARKPYSRQVSRVSGTGRGALQASPTAVLGSAAMPNAPAPEMRRGRSTLKIPKPLVESGPGPRPRSNFHRRSTSVDDMDHRQKQRVSGAPVNKRGRPHDNTNGSAVVLQPSSRPMPAVTARDNVANNSNSNNNNHNHNHHNNNVSRGHKEMRGTPGARNNGTLYAHGTPSSWQDKSRRQDGLQPSKGNPKATGGRGRGGVGVSDGQGNPPPLRRRNSAPDFGRVFEEAVQEASVEPTASPSRNSATCWGGGLPPLRGAIAQGPATARAAAVRAAPSTERFPENRFPANDRESFARTLNEEELDEVWQGLGEGVSQRGAGSEVAFEGRPGPASPRTAVSGAFPMLTANILERHDQLAVGGDGSKVVTRPPNVMPIPKEMGDKTAEDMENGTPTSKKSDGSSHPEHPSLLGAIVCYGVLVLWMAHLVFNVLLLWRIVVDHFVWALCFVPGFFGILLSINSCRKSHHNCKPAVEEDEERPRRSAPHPCALPAYMLLLLSVVVALGMHASAMLFCQKDVQLFITEDTVEPLCNGNSLLLPVVLDAVLLAVVSLKSSSLCWAWVLS